ncbi:MAG: hypothetical protein K8T89_00080 [Planctomycetes bacterium]|nr:hypothetical protein [Planctomycetota bacterium]
MLLNDGDGAIHFRSSLLILYMSGFFFGIIMPLSFGIFGAYQLFHWNDLKDFAIGGVCVLSAIVSFLFGLHMLWKARYYRVSLFPDRVEWMDTPKIRTVLYSNISDVSHRF